MWWWVLIWVLLVVIAAAYLGSRAWAVWGQAKELGAEARRASALVEAIQGEVDRLGEPAEPPRPTVLDDPRQLRRERERARAALREQRRSRRAARRPGWARDVD